MALNIINTEDDQDLQTESGISLLYELGGAVINKLDCNGLAGVSMEDIFRLVFSSDGTNQTLQIVKV